MSINLSEQKRNKLLNNIKIMREKLQENPELLQSLADIESELKRKKYGLVWEEHEEKVDEELKTKIPVFVEDKELEIKSDMNKPVNFLLEGDNLHSLYLLEKTHKESIDVIYIDPPYNTGSKDFIYDDKLVDSEDGYRHSKWISFMNKRLQIAKRLLKDNGIIFISIDDNEQAQLRLLCDSIFGEQNFVGNIVWEKRTKCQNTKTAKYMLQSKTESVLVYKNKAGKYEFNLNFEAKREYPQKDENGEKYRLQKLGEMSSSGIRGRNTMIFEIDGILPKEGNQWKYGKETIEKFRNRNDLIIKKGNVYLRIRPSDEEEKLKPFWSLITKEIGTAESAKSELNSILGTKEHGFETVKPVNLIKDLLYHVIANNKNAIVLDFFAGSGTTGQALLELNKEDDGKRTVILCTNNENNICNNITYARLKNIIQGYSKVPGISANLKYYKTEYIDRFKHEDEQYYIINELSKYIKELVQLENGIDIEDKSIQVLFTDEEIDKFSKNKDLLKQCKILYVDTNALITDEQIELFEENSITVLYIPEYYFEDEILEVEQW